MDTNFLIKKLVDIANKSTCKRRKCGSIILKENDIIGAGYNSPPGELESQRRCHCNKENYKNKVTDKTCCVHAEQRAIMDALKNNPDKINNSRLFFLSLDKEGKPIDSGEPYCTICSKMALDVGIKEFNLFFEGKFKYYDTEEYNNISFQEDKKT
jgi:deoxycytidylate deaminase